MNTAYLSEIRSKSCYPVFRKFTDIGTALVFCVAALVAISGFASGQGVGIFLGIVLAVIIVLMGIFTKELSLMIVDIADATIDVAARADNSQNSEGFAGETARQQGIILRSRATTKVEIKPVVNVNQTDFMPEQESMGSCPNCESIIPLASQECKKCKASFEVGSTWKIQPL